MGLQQLWATWCRNHQYGDVLCDPFPANRKSGSANCCSRRFNSHPVLRWHSRWLGQRCAGCLGIRFHRQPPHPYFRCERVHLQLHRYCRSWRHRYCFLLSQQWRRHSHFWSSCHMGCKYLRANWSLRLGRFSNSSHRIFHKPSTSTH